MKKRADGRYCKQILIGYSPEGKKKYKTIYGQTIKEVEKKERDLRTNVEQGIIVDKDYDVILLKDWAIEWLDTYKLNKVEKGTYEMYLGSIKTHIIPMLGDIPIKKLKTIQIQQLINRILDRGNTRTAEICKLTIKQIIQQALYNRIIGFDITLGLQKIKYEKPEKRPLTEFEKLCIDTAQLIPRQRVFLNIMRYAGLRRGETLALDKKNIDFKTNKIHIKHSLRCEDSGYTLKGTKNGKPRTVPIPQILLSELRTYVYSIPGTKLFTTKKGDYMTKSAFTKFWKGIKEKLVEAGNNIKSVNTGYINDEVTFTPHICRHTYATDLYYAGVDVKAAQYLLGHSSVTITLEIYTHLDKSKIGESIEKLEQYLSQSKISQMAG